MGFFGRCSLQPHPRQGAGRLGTLLTLSLVAAFPILLQAQYSENQSPGGQPYADQAYPPPEPYPAQQQYPQQQNPYAGQEQYPQQQYPQQQDPYARQNPYPQQQQYPPYAAQAPSQNGPQLSPQQLDDLVAPIALYPDPLVGEVLAASTYPMEVAQAEQWVRDHNGEQPGALLDGAKQQNWDASIQGLVAFPSVLAQLTQNMSWTTALGNAFLSQQPDVMQAIQRMRQQAQTRGTLRSTPQETVTDDYQNGQPYVAIEPASPDTLYVPEYNPAYIWGTPAWGYYPALYYPGGAGLFWSPGINLSFCFGRLGWIGWGGWGWRPNWFGRSLWVNGAFFHRYGFHDYGFRGAGAYGRAAWTHSPEHRWGVPYGNHAVAARFGQSGYNGYRASAFNRGTYGGYNRGNYAVSNRGSYGGYDRSNYGAYSRSSYAQPSHYGNSGFEQHAFGGNRSSFGGYHGPAMPSVQNNHFASMGSSHGYSGFHSNESVHSGGNGGFHGGGGGSFHSSGGSHGGGGHSGGGGHGGGRR